MQYITYCAYAPLSLCIQIGTTSTSSSSRISLTFLTQISAAQPVEQPQQQQPQTQLSSAQPSPFQPQMSREIALWQLFHSFALSLSVYANFSFLFRQKQIACKLPLEQPLSTRRSRTQLDTHTHRERKIKRKRGRK